MKRKYTVRGGMIRGELLEPEDVLPPGVYRVHLDGDGDLIALHPPWAAGCIVRTAADLAASGLDVSGITTWTIDEPVEVP